MFVNRGNDGRVVGVFAVQQDEGQEELSDDHADIVVFREGLANPVPGQVSAGQLIQALADFQMLDTVDAAVAEGDALTQRLWARAAVFPRTDPMVSGIAAALGKTSEQLDDIFRLAATK